MVDKKWAAEKYALSKITIAFLPRRMLVKDAGSNEIGYTCPNDAIYIAKEHEIFSMLTEDEKRFFRKGVFAHEMLHQIFTDFDSHELITRTMKSSEAQVFALIANILEDPAIEYWASTKFGGSLLKSLKFSNSFLIYLSRLIFSKKREYLSLSCLIITAPFFSAQLNMCLSVSAITTALCASERPFIISSKLSIKSFK